MLYIILIGRAMAVVASVAAVYVSLHRDFPPGDQYPARLYIAFATISAATYGTLADLDIIDRVAHRDLGRVTGSLLYLGLALSAFMYMRASRYRSQVGPAFLQMHQARQEYEQEAEGE